MGKEPATARTKLPKEEMPIDQPQVGILDRQSPKQWQIGQEVPTFFQNPYWFAPERDKDSVMAGQKRLTGYADPYWAGLDFSCIRRARTVGMPKRRTAKSIIIMLLRFYTI